MAVICFNPAYEAEMNAYTNRIAAKLAEGVRPNINLRGQAIRKIFDDPNWIPTDTVPLPNKKVGMAVLKNHQSISEKMIEQGRDRNKGCMAISWIFIIVVVLVAAYAIAHFAGVV